MFYEVSISDIDLLGVMYCKFSFTQKFSLKVRRCQGLDVKVRVDTLTFSVS